MFVDKKTKLAIFMIIFIAFLTIIFIYFDNTIMRISKYDNDTYYKYSYKLREKKINIEIEFNDNDTYYNELENVHYYYIDEQYANTYLNLNAKIYANGKYKYKIDGEQNSKENTFYIDFDKPIPVTIYNDEYFYKTNVRFTCVPIMNIDIDSKSVITHLDYVDSKIKFYGKNSDASNEIQYIEHYAKIKVRGASSLVYPKKSYKICFENDLSFIGMYKSKEWALDSMYSDFSNIRNKLSFELWNDINSYTDDTIDNDLELEYIDVYINDKYIGLYLLKELINDKTLKIDKNTINNSGVIIKGINYLKMDIEKYDENKKTNIVVPYEMKYPNNVNDYSDYWDAIIEKMYDVNLKWSSLTEQQIFENYDIYNYVDYRIFTRAIMAVDNISNKNMYFSLKNMDANAKIIITPWDIDMSYGRIWTGLSPMLLGDDYSNFSNKTINIFTQKDYKEINSIIKSRYFELRKDILNIENINKLIDSYYNKIKYSSYRDNKIWLDKNLELEINNIKIWYENRINFLDKYVGEYNV